MYKNHKLLADSNFRNFITAHAIYSLVRWTSLSMLPLFVIQKFNAGDVLVVSLSLKFLPAIICAPIVANVSPKIGFKKLAIIAMIWLAIIQLGLIYTNDQVIFQGLVLLTGIMDMVIVACLLALRSQVIPNGENISANALFSMIDSISKIIGTALIVAMLEKLSLHQSSYGIALSLLLATITLLWSNIPLQKSPNKQEITIHYASFFRLFHKKPILWKIYIPSLGYAMLAGTRNLFLFWSNKEVFHNDETEWTLLLTAHGLGTILGSIMGIKILHWINKKISLLQAFLYLGLLRSVGFLTLAWISHFGVALPILIVLGLPEILETICLFTLLQKYLKGSEENIFYTFNTPVYYFFVVVGTLTGRLYTTGIITLQHFWILACFVAILTIVPFLFTTQKVETAR